MTYQTVLVGLDGSEQTSERLHVALAVAKRMSARRLIGILACPPAIMPTSLGEGAAFVGPELIQAQEQANRERIARLRADFDRATANAGLACSFFSEEGDPDQIVGNFARVADLTVIGQSQGGGLGAMMMEHAEQVVVAAGGPVLVLPNPAPTDPNFARNWLLAWDGGREAARALAFALPFLKRADQVVLVAIGEEYHASADLAAQRLAGHGANVVMEKLSDPEGSIGELLLTVARTKGCTAMAMGAYGHSRFRELIMGGATIAIVKDARIPVLFSA